MKDRSVVIDRDGAGGREVFRGYPDCSIESFIAYRQGNGVGGRIFEMSSITFVINDREIQVLSGRIIGDFEPQSAAGIGDGAAVR